MQTHAPTFWDWLQFFVMIGLFCYAMLVFIGDRVPALAGLSTVLRKASVKLVLIFVDRVGGWLCDFYVGIARGIWWVLITLWSGPPEPAGTVGSVNRFSAPDLPYVEPPAASPSPDPQTEPASVCLSADREPESPPVPPALRNIILNSAMSAEERKQATSRESLLDHLVAAGWNVGEIRVLLKGDNGKFAAEIEAARERLAQPAPAPDVTPIAGRELPPGATFPRRQPAP